MSQQDKGFDGDLYQILRVDEKASLEDIKRSYYELSLIHHPDKGGDMETFQKILKAFKVLTDSKKRQEYDRCLSQTYDDLKNADRDLGYHKNEVYIVNNEFDKDRFMKEFEESNDDDEKRELKRNASGGEKLEDLLEQRFKDREDPSIQMAPFLDPHHFNVNSFNQIFKQVKDRQKSTSIEETTGVGAWNQNAVEANLIENTTSFDKSDITMDGTFINDYANVTVNDMDVMADGALSMDEISRRLKDYQSSVPEIKIEYCSPNGIPDVGLTTIPTEASDVREEAKEAHD